MKIFNRHKGIEDKEEESSDKKDDKEASKVHPSAKGSILNEAEIGNDKAVTLHISPQGLYAVNTMNGAGADKVRNISTTADVTDNKSVIRSLFLSRKLPKARNLRKKLLKNRMFGHRRKK